MKPIVHSYTVKNDKGATLGIIDVLLGEEAIDAVHRFAIAKGLDLDSRNRVAIDVCKIVACKRMRPIVYMKDVNDNNGKDIGRVEILEGEEVIDAAVRFIRTAAYVLDEIALKNYLLSDACKNIYVKCTRFVAHVFDHDVKESEGKVIGRLIVRENEEPADKLHELCENTSKCSGDDRMRILEAVCNSDIVVCTRKQPIIFSQSITDPSGIRIGNLEILLFEEPADAVYRFFARHRLFHRGWDIHHVIDKVCNLPQLNCKRKRPVQYTTDNFQMGTFNIGPLKIWYGEEVVDILYEKRIEHNLTLNDQMASLSFICKQQDVHCERTRAVVYQLKDITKYDFEKFGNETCERKYMGWQFLSSVANSFFGSKVTKIVNSDYVKVVSAQY
jgi:hypothetical protein